MKKRKNLVPVLESRKVLNEQFSVVLTREGYYLHSEDNFFELKKDSKALKAGRILLNRSKQSDVERFLVVHQQNYCHTNIGILEFNSAGPKFTAC